MPRLPVAKPAARRRVAEVPGRLVARAPFRWIPLAAWAPIGIVGGLLAVTVAVFEKQLLGHWTFPWDFVGSYTTSPAFVAASVSDGHLLSWSPFVASGFPVDIDPQAGVYFPGWWLLGGLGIPATLRVLTTVQVAHVLFGAVGVLALARARRLEWSWAALAALAYLFFGGFYGEAEHADIFRGFAYLPWLLWALTPPAENKRWLRLAALPALAWLVASGAYPGQMVSFGITGFVYLVVALAVEGRGAWQQYRAAIAFAALASALACVVVLLPYLRAEQAHELHRVLEPTATVRAGASIAPRDLLGLYLNNFAWIYDGTVTAWTVGIPILIGLACVRLESLRRHAPLLACSALALALAMTPKIGPIGRVMVSLRPLFPSRFPAADYKAVVAVGLIILSADAWSGVAASRRKHLAWPAMLAGCVVIVGALLAPSRYGQPTRVLWLVVAVAVVCVALVLVRIPVAALLALLLVLVVVDGVREIYDYRLLGKVSSWQVTPAEAAPYRARAGYVRKLPKLLDQAPARRPARVPPAMPLSSAPTGSDNDATGWIAEGYHLVDYGGTIENSLWRAEQSPPVLDLLLKPWHAYAFPCLDGRCAGGRASLPAPGTWRPDPDVRTLRYGINSIVYSVDVAKPTLMIENELAILGWHSNTSRVRSVNVGLPLRAWRLSPGRYDFTASYDQPGRTAQELALVAALCAWLVSMWLLRRKPPFAGQAEQPA